MGHWGAGIFENDIAMDLKDAFDDLLDSELTMAEITEQILEKFEEELEDTDDALDFWLALADAQIEAGALLAQIKNKALELIEAGIADERWHEESQQIADERKKVIAALKARLIATDCVKA